MFTRTGLQDLYAPVARRLNHQLKMAKKQRQRLEASGRRTAEYERMKADAHRVVLKMRTWLKSPYAFRRGGL